MNDKTGVVKNVTISNILERLQLQALKDPSRLAFVPGDGDPGLLPHLHLDDVLNLPHQSVHVHKKQRSWRERKGDKPGPYLANFSREGKV